MTEISKQLQQEARMRQVQEQPWADNKRGVNHNYVFGSGCGKKASKIDLAQVSWHLLGATLWCFAKAGKLTTKL